MRVVIWGAPDLHSELSALGISAAAHADARAGLVRIERARDLDFLRQLREQLETLPVVAMIERDPEHAELVLRAVELGVLGVVVRDAPAAEVARALDSVVQGRAALDATAAEQLIRALRQRADRRERFGLTTRERDVLAELVTGRTTLAIAHRLGISFGTVQTHVKNIYRKLDVSSKAAATALALRHQLV
jgi:DNA-binding NarL/FixJ family response regulator